MRHCLKSCGSAPESPRFTESAAPQIKPQFASLMGFMSIITLLNIGDNHQSKRHSTHGVQVLAAPAVDQIMWIAGIKESGKP
jgi:hypothetical protein